MKLHWCFNRLIFVTSIFMAVYMCLPFEVHAQNSPNIDRIAKGLRLEEILALRKQQSEAAVKVQFANLQKELEMAGMSEESTQLLRIKLNEIAFRVIHSWDNAKIARLYTQEIFQNLFEPELEAAAKFYEDPSFMRVHLRVMDGLEKISTQISQIETKQMLIEQSELMQWIRKRAEIDRKSGLKRSQ